MNADTLAWLGASPVVLYGVLLPLVLVQLFALLCIPSLMAAPAKARSIVDAIHCYLMQGLGVLLMSVGALPTVFSVLAGVSYPGGTYFGLLLVFAAGGALFLWQDNRSRGLDAASKAVPGAIFFGILRLIGQTSLILAGISFLLSITLEATTVPGWWMMPVLVAVYGALLTWCTKSPSTPRAHTTLQIVGLGSKMTSRPAKAPVKSVAAGKKRK